MKKWLLLIVVVPAVGLILFVAISFLRLQMAKFEMGQAAQTLSADPAFKIGETDTLEILPLYEEIGQAELQNGHGVSYLIRTDSTTILFDLGNNMAAASPSPLEQNMGSLGISLNDIDQLVLSHRHPDHVGGQNWWTEKTFSLNGRTQPSLGSIPVYIPEEMSYPSGSLILAKTPTLLANGVATTGIIPYAQPFPIWLAAPKGGEQALAVNLSGHGLVLITGCGHMGVESLLKQAQTAFDIPVVGLVGGLHYGDAQASDLQTEMQVVQALNPKLISLSPHDSSPAVIDAFEQAFSAAYSPIVVGKPIHMPGHTAVR